MGRTSFYTACAAGLVVLSVNETWCMKIFRVLHCGFFSTEQKYCSVKYRALRLGVALQWLDKRPATLAPPVYRSHRRRALCGGQNVGHYLRLSEGSRWRCVVRLKECGTFFKNGLLEAEHKHMSCCPYLRVILVMACGNNIPTSMATCVLYIKGRVDRGKRVRFAKH